MDGHGAKLARRRSAAKQSLRRLVRAVAASGHAQSNRSDGRGHNNYCCIVLRICNAEIFNSESTGT
jgi:hypothetical protein